MLMNIDVSIVQSIKVSLTFDDNKTKTREIAVGDLCVFEFNKNGVRKHVEGKVLKISASDTTNTSAWSIVVDSSLDFSGSIERFSPTQILDVDVIQKHDSSLYISTPNDYTRITDMRLVDGYLQVSIDGGYSWSVPKNYVDDGGEVEDESGTTVKHCHKHHKKPVVIEDDDTSSSTTTTTGTTSTDTSSSSTDSETEVTEETY